MPLPKKPFTLRPPWQTAWSYGKSRPYTTVLGFGHGCGAADCSSIRSTLSGWTCDRMPHDEKNLLTMSAATPAAFGVAIDVPCSHAYGAPPSVVSGGCSSAGRVLVDDQAPRTSPPPSYGDGGAWKTESPP